MPTLKELQARLRKIERATGSHLVTFTMPDGSTKKISNSRVLQAMYDGIAEDGIRSREIETILASVSSNADHKLVELFKMCVE
jgi:type IV pilus biogenesis protein CpaD/CtpE